MWLFRRKETPRQGDNKPLYQPQDSQTMNQPHTPTVSVPYALPNNLQEVNRLDFQHYILRQALGANYLAPLDHKHPPESILDVGCGTGRWLAEMYQQFPGSRIVGVDYVAPPDGAQFPPEGAFIESNVLEGLPFVDESFDFVHQRLLVAALPFNHWPMVINELIRITRIGGWIELAETDGVFQPHGYAIQQFDDWAQRALRQRGIDTLQVRNIKTHLEVQKLDQVKSHVINIPIGKWAGRIGQMTLVDLQTAHQGLKPLIMMANGITAQQYDEQLEQVYQEYEKLHTCVQYVVIYGQRSSTTQVL
jgi:ubiquinone/menaquinone biosynthesis C-methylase UbiE